MKSIINKGRHYQRLWPVFPNGIYLNAKKMDCLVSFDLTCKYDFGTSDNYDVNKLFGQSFTLDHHKESARFGWNWNQDEGKVNLFSYCYVNGERMFSELCEILLYKEYILCLSFIPHGYVFEVFSDVSKTRICGPVLVAHYHKLKLSYRLGDYFGGNRTAPHRMVKKIKRSDYGKTNLENINNSLKI